LVALMSAQVAVAVRAIPGQDEVQDDAPWFYHGLEGPRYQVVEAKEGYEIRNYPATFWAATEIKGKSLDNAGNEGFMRLFKYISGANEDKAKIDMTVPVLVTVKPGDGPFCKEDFVYHFFMPELDGKAPPAPTNDEVFLTELPAFTVAVGSYSGWSNEKKVIETGRALFETLASDGVDFVKDEYFTAGYDSPFRLIDRHNEVWVELASNATTADALFVSSSG